MFSKQNNLFLSLFCVLSLILSATFAGCDVFVTEEPGEPEPFERRELPRKLTANETGLVDGTGSFGFKLMHNLLERQPGESHFISPLSILMAYGMTMNGAEGETYSQMQEVFELTDMSRDQINKAAKDLIELLIQYDENVQFNIANSIWYRNTFEVENVFLETNLRYFDATVEAADFGDPETKERINQWVSEKTEGLIEEIIEGTIDPLTVMYLINAIYFKGDWTVPFDPDNTQSSPFYLPDGSSKEVDMMRMETQEEMLYAEGEDYQAVNLYYGDAGFAMTLVLPDEGSLKNWLTAVDWNKWQELSDIESEFSEVILTLEMPKFELAYDVKEFKKILQEMGMINAFDPQKSDFSRINPDADDLHISDTRHKTFVRVNEEGTEAAAVTSVTLVESAPQNVSISLDRPFFYVIREVESGTILFMGTMMDPS